MSRATNTSAPEFQTIDSVDRKPFLKRGLSIICAVGITSALMLGYSYLRWRHAQKLRAEETAQNPVQVPTPSPQVQVFVDEAMIKGSQALLGGAIQNISQNQLTSVTLQIELKRRKDGSSEVRSLAVEPADLNSGQIGRYALTIPSHEYRESHVQSIKADQALKGVPFKLMPGTERPDERLPTREIIVTKPSKRSKGEEFINTPDNPVKVP